MKKIGIIAVAALMLFGSAAAEAKSVSINIPSWSGDSTYDETQTDETWVWGKLVRDNSDVPNGRAAYYSHCGGYMNSTWARISQNVSGLEVGEKYLLSAKIYSSGQHGNHVFRFDGTDLVSCDTLIKDNKMSDAKWCDVEYEFTFNFGSTNLIILNWNTGEFNLDDISIKKIITDEETGDVTYGEELIKNGGFEEDLDDTPCAEVTDVKVQNKDCAATITWVNPKDSDFLTCAVYDVTDGKNLILGKTADGKYELTGLKNNKEYTYKIVTLDEWENASAGTTVTVKPIADEFKSTKPVFEIDGKAVSSLAPGALEIKLSYKNNRMSEDYSVEAIAVLMKDGAAVDVNSAYAIIPKEDEEEPYTDLSVPLTVPSGDGYSVALYIWNSLTDMTALDEVYILQ